VAGLVEKFDPTISLADSKPLALEASAGTGKTYSITTLFLRFIAQGIVRPDQILVVTFTELATAQMRERIRARLRDALVELNNGLDPDYQPPSGLDETVAWLLEMAKKDGSLNDMISRIKVALAGFDEIYILTIHGFCYRMLLQNAFESGTEFNTVLVPNVKDIIADFVYDYWTKISCDTDEALLDAIFKYCSPDDLVTLGSKIGQNDAITIAPKTKEYDPQTQAEWMRLVGEFVDAWELEKGTYLQDLLDRAENKIINGTPFKLSSIQKFQHVLESIVLPKFIKGNPFADSKDELSAIERFSNSYVVSKVYVRQKAAFEALPPLPRCAHLLDQILEFRPKARQNQMSFFMQVRTNFLRELQEKLPSRKSELQVMGFDDLLRNLRDALKDPKTGPSLRAAIRNQFKVAMIDEFQDTDPVQYEIFKDLFKAGHRLIFIGDPKQSIYSFRMADIDTYLKAIEDVRKEQGRVLSLTTNWRSDGTYVMALNHLYSQAFNPFLRANIQYHEVDVPKDHEGSAWQSDAETWQSSLRLAWIVNDTYAKEGNKGAINLPQARNFAVNFTAQDILRVLESDVTYKDNQRVKPGDIAVIVATHKQAVMVASALSKLGIPSVRRSQQTIFQTQEVTDFIWLLRAVLNPGNLTALKTGLVTDFIGVKASELADLEDDEALDGWLKRFHEWRDIWERFGLMRMFTTILGQRNSLEKMVEGLGGERRVTNYLHLAQELHEAGQRLGLGPEGQLDWLIKVKNKGEDEGADEDLIRLESDEQAVRIITTHAAKGLEYPFVWLPFLWDMKVSRPKNVIFHKDDGTGESRLFAHIAPEDDGEQRMEAEGLAYDAQFGEKMRLVYVGLTRARHACTIVGAFHRDYAKSPLHHLTNTSQTDDPDSLSQTDLPPADPPLPLSPPQSPSLLPSLSDKDKEILAGLQTIAAGSGGTIAAFPVIPSEYIGASTWNPPKETAIELETDEPLTRRLDPNWIRSSFSGMLRSGTAGDEHETKRDEEPSLGGVATAEGTCPKGPVYLDEYPRGAKIGDLIHDVLEQADFGSDGPEFDRLVLEFAKTARIEEPFPLKDGRHIYLSEGLKTALKTPLGLAGTAEHDLRLAALTKADTLRELEFHLAVRGGLNGPSDGNVTHKQLISAFKDNPDPTGIVKTYLPFLEQLEFSEFKGYLTGFIDLVFRWGPDPNGTQKWYLADYKSNRVVNSFGEASLWSDYLPENLAQKMAQAHYVLQYHLYVMVLHRYLQQRLAGYDYETHFGEVYYLFIRGMQAGLGDTGVFRDRPPLARIEALSKLFQERP